MTFGDTARTRLHALIMLLAALVLASLSQTSFAQTATPAPAAATVPAATVPATPPVTLAPPAPTPAAAAAASGYKPLGPEWIKGKPTPGAISFQPQYSDDGRYAKWMHNAVLMPVITAITVFVLGLMLFVMFKFRRSANPVPSKTSHNALIEVIWTVVPALILVVIAVPSMILLNQQFRTAPKDALTIKATGYQWYWGYTYPDNGGFEVIANMLPKEEALKRGEPEQLAADNRMVVPVGVPVRMQITGADVIHSFGIPSLWFKLDAVPGRLNERVLTIDEPGIYYGQCSELCGARHAYMPIAIEAVPAAQFAAFIRSQGGTMPGDAAPAAPVAMPSRQPVSSALGAPAANAEPDAAAPAQDVAPGAAAPTT